MNKFWRLLVAALVVYFLVSLPFYSGDVKNHLVWAQSILKEGTYGFYFRDFPGFAYQNYPPVAMFGFVLSLKLYGAISFLINHNGNFGLVNFWNWENVRISFLKLSGYLPILFISLGIFLWTKKRYTPALLFLLSPAVVYLGVIWGQIDLLPLMFIFWAFYLLREKKLYWSMILAALSLLSKQTVLVFWIFYLIVLFKQFGWINALKTVGIGLLIFEFAYLPFFGLDFTTLIAPFVLYKLNFSLVDFTTSVNAINMWGLIDSFKGLSDQTIFLGLTLQLWGYLFFGTSFALILWKFLRSKFDQQRVVESLFLLSLTDFFFLTRMHERYLIPTVLFSILMVGTKRGWMNFIFFSVLCFLNLYRGLLIPDSVLVKLVNFLPLLQLLVVCYGLLIIYNFYHYLHD